MSGITYAGGCGGVGEVGAGYVGGLTIGGVFETTGIFIVGVGIAVLPHDIPSIELNPILELQPAGNVGLLLTTTDVAVQGPTTGHGPVVITPLLPPPLLEIIGGVEVFVIIFFDIGGVFCFSFLDITFSTCLSLVEIVGVGVGIETGTTGGWTTCFLNQENGFHQLANTKFGIKKENNKKTIILFFIFSRGFY
ncbi:hypothetical protein M0P48_05175 [Candidatus Gracilibacteria bacterium]|nr:hypothetical protein [Candidatus Gracilibacteria bacterium]